MKIWDSVYISLWMYQSSLHDFRPRINKPFLYNSNMWYVLTFQFLQIFNILFLCFQFHCLELSIFWNTIMFCICTKHRHHKKQKFSDQISNFFNSNVVYVGLPTEDVFSGHHLSPIFQPSLHITFTSLCLCVGALRFSHLLLCALNLLTIQATTAGCCI